MFEHFLLYLLIGSLVGLFYDFVVRYNQEHGFSTENHPWDTVWATLLWPVTVSILLYVIVRKMIHG